MCREMKMNRPWLHGLLIALLLAPLTLLADASRDYAKGLKAFQKEDFAAASASFRSAIADDRKEGLQKIRGTGVSFDDYLPFYYLGLCLERLGQNKEALAALEESERQGAILEKRDLRVRLQSTLARLRSRAAEAAPTPLPPPTPTPLPALPPTPPSRPQLPPTAIALPTQAVSRPPVPASPTVERIVLGRATPTASPVVAAGPSAEMAAVRLGAEQFFRSQYDAAIQLLTPHADGIPAARLLLSFSIAGRALLSDRPDDRQISEAKALYASALERGAKVDGEGLISPRILELVSGSARSTGPGR
jgi:tetratricopeptide (TPR) repeat protein